MASLKIKSATVEDKFQQDSPEMANHGIALADIVIYINEVRMDGILAPVFKLADLVNLYSTRLEQLGVKEHDHPHNVHLKNCIFALFPDHQVYKEGCRDALLAFDNDLRPALHKAYEYDYTNEAICLAKTVNIVFGDMLIFEAILLQALLIWSVREGLYPIAFQHWWV